MLNLLSIQFLAPLAYTLLRVCLGLILIRFGTYHLKHRSPSSTIVVGSPIAPHTWILLSFGVLEVVGGVSMLLGFYTQVGALIGITLSGIQVIKPSMFTYPTALPRTFFVLMFCVSVSLFITGAGIFAFDLPI